MAFWRSVTSVVVAAALSMVGGSGRAEPIRSPTAIGGIGAASAIPRARAVAAGLAHSCALTSAGAVKCWGYNGHDELGTGRGDSVDSSTPVSVSGLRSGVVAISAGVRHSCALTSGGGVKCWGYGRSGVLGDGGSQRRFAPVDVVGLSTGVIAISAGNDHSCALTSVGVVKCWGANTAGVLGDGTTIDRWTPVEVAGLPGGVRAIAAGNLTACAVLQSGGVSCWGDHYGLTPVKVSGLAGGVKAITAGGPLCALTSTGGVKCWGGDYGWTPVAIPGLSRGVIAIAANVGHSCALSSAGAVRCWGLNDHGQLGDGTKTNRSSPKAVSWLGAKIRAIAAGGFHTCALSDAGSVTCWGGNYSGQLGDGTRHLRLTPVDVVGFAELILPTHTPGAHYSAVTQKTLFKTVCRSGWTATIRPPMSYTNALKRTQLAQFGYADRNPAHYEEDHLISLGLGGAPRSTRNLWPQPWSQARRDDNGIEASLHRQLCAGTLTLRQARAQEVAYKHRLG